MTTIKVCRVYNKYTEESDVQVVFERNNKQYFGALFWEKDPGDRITRHYETVEVSCESEIDEVNKVLETYIELCQKHGLKVFKDTLKTMRHWQYIHSFSNVIYSGGEPTVVNY